MNPTIEREIRDFIRSGEPAAGPHFDGLLRRALSFQLDRVEPLRRLARARGLTLDALDALPTWSHVPLVPVLAFKSLDLSAAAPEATFLSSGTLGERSRHGHPFLDLYRETIDATFPGAVLAGCAEFAKPDMLSLVASRESAPDSSLSFMIDHVLGTWGGRGSAVGIGPRGVEAAKVRSWLGAHQRGGAPIAILTTGFALVELLDALERLGVRFRMPPGSVIFETGGLKGRGREISREELLDRVEGWLGIPRQRLVREYGMTELTSQCYTEALAGGDPDLFVPPAWVRVRALDPETLAPTAAGAAGLLAIFDLANVGSALHVLTQDLGVEEGRGFRLLGRAAGAELRGCSLAVEELRRI
jgi:hypothetical protein